MGFNFISYFNFQTLVVDRCDPSNLQRTSGRPLLEMHMNAPSGIIRAIEMVICGVMPFFIQVWRPVRGAKNFYQLVWQKQITCLPGRSNGRIVQVGELAVLKAAFMVQVWKT